MIHCNTKMSNAIYLGLLVFALLSCNQTTPTKSNESEIQVIPNAGVIGMPLMITGASFDSLFYYNQILFAGRLGSVKPDSGSASAETLWTHVPFGSASGELTISNDEQTYVYPEFHVLEKSPDSVKVQWYNLPDPLQEQDALQLNWGGDPVPWNGTRRDSLIIFTVLGSCGDECSYRDTLTFQWEPSKVLPEFVSYVEVVHDFPSWTRKHVLEAGLIKIQSYQINGVISGKIYSDNLVFDERTFWYNFQEEQARERGVK